MGASAVIAVGLGAWLSSAKLKLKEITAFDPSVLAYLAAWVLVPLVVFTIQPVKEPRHILPILPALFMLAAMSVQGFTGRSRDLIRAGCAVFSLISYGLLLCAGRNPLGGTVPYFTKGAVRGLETADVVAKEMAPTVIGKSDGGAKVPSQDLWVRYNLDIAITGLPPDESLALTWALRPAVVYDLDQLPQVVPGPQGLWLNQRSDLPLHRYEDLFVYSSFNQYNARCGLPYRYEWLEGQTGVRTIRPHAVIRPSRARPIPFYYNGAENRPVRSVSIERPDNPTGPLSIDFYAWPVNLPNSRQIYAWEMLNKGRNPLEDRGPPLERNEVPTVLASLRRSYVLRKDWDGLRVVAALYPDLRSQSLRPRRNLYWYGFYPALENIERVIWYNSPFASAAAAEVSAP